MPQKILAGRASDPQLKGDLVKVKVDQVILSRAPARALACALDMGLKKAIPEVSIAYDGTAVTTPDTLADAVAGASNAVTGCFPSYGVLVARPGIGFPAPVHIERFAAPGRLALTDDARLAPVGGVGMLCLTVSPAQLGMAMATGSVWLRPPRSIQIHLSGRTRPFVCARDIALELLRRDVADTVRRIENEFHAPVVLEFAGPSARMLSVGQRAVLCGIAHQVGAAAALFISDDKAEVFLRDQRRSKAHRALVPDPGAPCEEVLTIDLATVDPLIMDETGEVRTARELADRPVSQVVLGGDSGVTLRDMLAAATLLKSKRIPPRLDLLLAPPSRQVLEVLGQSGALVDLVATGARVVEPDRRLMSGELYPPPDHSASLRNVDPEPWVDGSKRYLIASAETLSYAVAHGVVGDPRAFKRPARVTVPRVLPTEDVLVVRAKNQKKAAGTVDMTPPKSTPPVPWKGAMALDLHFGVPEPQKATNNAPPTKGGGRKRQSQGQGLAVVLTDREQVRAVLEIVALGSPIRLVIASHVPSQVVSSLASEGVASFEASASAVASMKNATRLSLPKTSAWGAEIVATAGKTKVPMCWLATDRERDWTQSGRTSAS